MIRYEKMFARLAEAGWDGEKLLKQHILGPKMLRMLQNNEPVSLELIDRICRLLKCQPREVMEWTPDEAGR